MIPKELQEIRASVEQLSKQYKELKGQSTGDDKVRELEDMIFRIADYLHARLSYLEDDIYSWISKHSVNHVPSLKIASQMEKFLKVCGMDNDFEIIKPTIRVSNASRNPTLEVEYKKKS